MLTAEQPLTRGFLWFRYEAAQLPDIVVSSLDARQFDQNRTKYVPDYIKGASGDNVALNHEWLEAFVQDFANLRASFRR